MSEVSPRIRDASFWFFLSPGRGAPEWELQRRQLKLLPYFAAGYESARGAELLPCYYPRCDAHGANFNLTLKGRPVETLTPRRDVTPLARGGSKPSQSARDTEHDTPEFHLHESVRKIMKPLFTAARIVGNYWSQPVMWPSIWRTLQTGLSQKLRPGFAAEQRRKAESERRLAEEWCAARAISTEELPSRLPFTFELSDPRSVFPEEFKAAESRVAACPHKLGGAGNLSLLYSLAKAIKAERMLETGVAYGWSSLALLLAAKDSKTAKLVSVDLPYLWIGNDEWVGIAVPAALRSHWELLRMGDREALPRAIRSLGSLDFAHYDSDKSVKGRLFAYGLIWQEMRPGGVFVSDDIGDNGAFKEFCLSIGREPVIISRDKKFQGLLVK